MLRTRRGCVALGGQWALLLLDLTVLVVAALIVMLTPVTLCYTSPDQVPAGVGTVGRPGAPLRVPSCTWCAVLTATVVGEIPLNSPLA